MIAMKMFTKWSVVGIAIILLFTVEGVAGCDTCTIYGRYVNPDLPEAFIKIESDGTCIGWGFMAGRWKVSDGELRITSTCGLFTYAIQENKLIDENGDVWVKEDM